MRSLTSLGKARALVAVLGVVGVGSSGVSLLAFGKSKGHKAHEHGTARLNVVAEGNKATLQFEVPAESILGFEHEAKTDADKQKKAAALETLKSRFKEMVVFESKLECSFTPVKADVQMDSAASHHESKKGHDKKDSHGKSGEHSEVHAEFTVACAGPVAGSTLTFGFAKVFPAIGSVKVQVLSGERQNGATIKKDKGTVAL